MLKMNCFAGLSSLRDQVHWWNSWTPLVHVGTSASSIIEHKYATSHRLDFFSSLYISLWHNICVIAMVWLFQDRLVQKHGFNCVFKDQNKFFFLVWLFLVSLVTKKGNTIFISYIFWFLYLVGWDRCKRVGRNPSSKGGDRRIQESSSESRIRVCIWDEQCSLSAFNAMSIDKLNVSAISCWLWKSLVKAEDEP